MRGWILTAALMATIGSAMARTETALPIATGLWINATDKCATITNGYIYDGAQWGAVYYYGPNASMGPIAELEKIGRANAVNDGFTNMQLGETEGVGYFQVKSLAPNRMMLRTGAPGPEGIQVMDDMLVRCGFTTLSPKMKTAIERFAPALAK